MNQEDEIALRLAEAAASWGAKLSTTADTTGPQSGVNIVVGTAPSSDLGLAKDVHLVKPALLYGDAVTLYSPAAALLSLVRKLPQLTGDSRLDFMAQVLPIVQPVGGQELAETVEGLRLLQRKKRRSPAELNIVMVAKRELESQWKALALAIESIAMTFGAAELEPAIQSGLLSIDPLLPDGGFSTDELMLKFIDRLGRLLESHVAYPLFDDQTGELVQSGITDGLFSMSPGVSARGKQVSIAADLLGRLPTFPQAMVKELLDIREELAGPLVPFRGLLVEWASELQATATQPELAEEIQDLYLARVAPTLQELEEKIRADSYLSNLLGRVSDNSAVFTALLTLGVTGALQMPRIIAAGAALSQAAIRAMLETRSQASENKQSTLYFLYRTEDLLSG